MTPVVLGAHKNNGLKLFPPLDSTQVHLRNWFSAQAGILCPSSTSSTKELRFDWRRLAPAAPAPGYPWHQATTHGDAGFGLELTPNLAETELIYLVVSTHFKNISPFGSFPEVGVEIKMFETTTQLWSWGGKELFEHNWFSNIFSIQYNGMATKGIGV